MQYNQPFDQASNPNASYVNGNPSSGIQGSIIPAGAVEYPQRELLALIQAAGLTPSNGDLSQVAKAIQSGAMNTSSAGGAVNAYTATLTPAPSSYRWGTIVNLWFPTPNTGASTLNLNGIGALPILSADGLPVVAYDLFANVTLLCAGSAFIIQNVRTSSEGARGTVQLASAAETAAGTNTSKPASVARMAAAVQSGEWLWCGGAYGTANAIAVSSTPAFSTLADGQNVIFLATAVNTGAATLNYNGSGAAPIVDCGFKPLQGGEITGIVRVIRFGTNWVITSLLDATETSRGVVQLADAATVTAGTNLTKPVSVARVAAAVQSGQWNYAADTGAVNALVANLSPAPNAYYAGLSITVKVANTNTGGATVNVNGLGAKSIVHKDGTPLQPQELQAGQIAFLTYDGTFFQFDVSYGRLLNIQVFTASGTYIPTPGMAFVRVRMVGGGGAGSGGNIPASGQVTLGAPGGAGTYAEGKFSSSQVGASKAVTIGNGGAGTLAAAGGNGGTTSFGSLMTAPGGIGGQQLVNQTAPTVNGNGNVSSAPTGANVLGVPGGASTSSIAVSTAVGVAGIGGNSPFGTGGAGVGVNANGASASGFGAGGGGVCVNISVGASTSGGNGSPGYMIIEEYSL